ncbi:hypothetical protein GCM10009789_51800 [Kribbella sancticallisti]|uniref:DUF7134 domain-containing protein n=1 Tax=Kribbella sancticallisti TaxID=460087 RepID=A0ABN2E0X7_9ACTN
MQDTSGLGRPLDRRHLIALDCLVAAVYAVLVGISTAADASTPNWAWLLVVGMAAAAAVRRVWPRSALAFVAGLSLLAVVLGVLRDPLLAASYCLYVVALTSGSPTTKRLLGTAGVVGAALLFLAALGTPASTNLWTSEVSLALTGVTGLFMTWMLGKVVQDRRAVAVRAARQLAQRAVIDERLRIARELHDIVGTAWA